MHRCREPVQNIRSNVETNIRSNVRSNIRFNFRPDLHCTEKLLELVRYATFPRPMRCFVVLVLQYRRAELGRAEQRLKERVEVACGALVLESDEACRVAVAASLISDSSQRQSSRRHLAFVRSCMGACVRTPGRAGAHL